MTEFVMGGMAGARATIERGVGAAEQGAQTGRTGVGAGAGAGAR